MDDPSRPLFNRNVLGGGPPGSTVKPLIAPGRPRQRPAHAGRQGLLHRHVPHPRPAPRLARCARRRRLDRPAQVDRAVGQLSTTTSSPTTWASSSFDAVHAQATASAQPHRHRPGRREQRRRAVAGVEGASARKEPLVSGRDRQRRHRPGLLDGDGAAARARHRRASPMAATCARLHLAAERRDGYDAPWMPIAATGADAHHRQRRSNLRAVQEGMIATIHGRRHRRGDRRAARRT